MMHTCLCRVPNPEVHIHAQQFPCSFNETEIRGKKGRNKKRVIRGFQDGDRDNVGALENTAGHLYVA